MNSWGDFGDWVALVQTAATVVALWFAFKAAQYGRDAVRQGREAGREAARERLSRTLGELAEAASDLELALYRPNREQHGPLQVRLRALLVATEGYAELPRTFDLADAPLNTIEEVHAAQLLVKPAIDELGEAARSTHRVIRAPAATATVRGGSETVAIPGCDGRSVNSFRSRVGHGTA